MLHFIEKAEMLVTELHCAINPRRWGLTEVILAGMFVDGYAWLSAATNAEYCYQISAAVTLAGADIPMKGSAAARHCEFKVTLTHAERAILCTFLSLKSIMLFPGSFPGFIRS